MSQKPEYIGRTAQETCGYKGKYPRNYKENTKRTEPGEVSGYNRESDPERQHTGGMHISIMVKRDHRFSADQTGADRV